MRIQSIKTVFSPDRTYRYTLQRSWAGTLSLLPVSNHDTGFLQVIGLNPSTADENRDDNTVRRCMQYAKDWGYNGLVMTNLFGLRSTDPKGMLSHPEPIGDDNNFWLRYVADQAAMILCAWGNDGKHLDRARDVLDRVLGGRELHHLKLTGAGQPNHPLYLAKTLTPLRLRS